MLQRGLPHHAPNTLEQTPKDGPLTQAVFKRKLYLTSILFAKFLRVHPQQESMQTFHTRPRPSLKSPMARASANNRSRRLASALATAQPIALSR